MRVPARLPDCHTNRFQTAAATSIWTPISISPTGTFDMACLSAACRSVDVWTAAQPLCLVACHFEDGIRDICTAYGVRRLVVACAAIRKDRACDGKGISRNAKVLTQPNKLIDQISMAISIYRSVHIRHIPSRLTSHGVKRSQHEQPEQTACTTARARNEEARSKDKGGVRKPDSEKSCISKSMS